MLVPFDVNQEEWGSSLVYEDDPFFSPDYVLVHWGGSTNAIDPSLAPHRLRAWQSYHINSKGMRDIAYNYAFDDAGTIYRCRGLNNGGHTKTYDLTPEDRPYNTASIGIVWIGGKGAGEPTPEGYAGLQRFCDAVGLPVKHHRQAKIENGSWTECPGTALIDWVNNYKPEDMMPTTQWHQMIDALFEGSAEFNGDPNYWKNMPEDSPEWRDFWSAFVRAIS